MKLFEILLEAGAESSFNISTDDMEKVFPLVSRRELDKQEVMDMAAQLADEGEFSRTPGSAQFIINRMHVLVHGVAPHGYTERSAERMMMPSRPLVAFLQTKGVEPEENLRRAKIELKSRKAQISQEQATKMMADGAKMLSPEEIKILKPLRNEIIADIMAGLTAQEAFQRHM